MFGTVDFDRLPARLRDAADGVADLGPVDQEAAQLVHATGRPPIRTGRLASSVVVRAGELSSSLTYAAPVHWGWTRGRASVAARPWILHAADAKRDQVIELYRKHVVKELGRID